MVINMKTIVILIMCILSYYDINAQSNVFYEYDGAGNRIGIIVAPSKIKIMDLNPNYIVRNCLNFELVVCCIDENDQIQKALFDINFEIRLNSGYGALNPTVYYGSIPKGQCSCIVNLRIAVSQSHSELTYNYYTLKLSALGFPDFISSEISVYRYAAEPLEQVSDISASNIGRTSMNLSWSPVDGYAHIVVADSTTNPFPLPIDGFGFGSFNDDIVNFITSNTMCYSCSAKVIYNGTANSIFVQGLYPNRTYRFRIYKYNMNCTAVTTKYNMTEANNNPNQFTTLLKSSESENEYDVNYSIISISPIPASDILKIDLSIVDIGKINIEIYNEIGEKVYLSDYIAKSGRNIIEINLKANSIFRGSYYIKIIDSQLRTLESSFVVK